MTGQDREQLVRDLEHQVAMMLRRVRRVIAERARGVDEDLAPAAYLMLAQMVRHGPVRPSELVDSLDLDKGAVSRHVQQLVDLGLAVKDRDPADGRAWIVAATDEARRRLDAVGEQRRARLDRMLGDWTVEELSGFVDSLGRYNQTLE